MNTLDVIERQASETVFLVERGSPYGSEPFKDKMDTHLYNIKRDELKLRYLSSMLEELQKLKEEHEKDCGNKNNCPTTQNYAESIFYTQQEIDEIRDDINVYGNFNRWNVPFYGDRFEESEIKQIKTALDEIQNQNKDLKEEITELKELLHILNKKNWKEVVLGKVSDELITVENLKSLIKLSGKLFLGSDIDIPMLGII